MVNHIEEKIDTEKWYTKTKGVIILLIFFFPVGVFFMWKYCKDWSIWRKLVISLYFFFTLISLVNDRSQFLSLVLSFPIIIGLIKFLKKSDYFKLKVECVLCNNETGLNRNKTKYGWICRNCIKKLAKENVNLFQIRKYSLEELKSISKKEDKIKQRIQENRDNAIACCPKCGSASLSANKKGYGIGKGVIGMAATGGLIGLVAGNLGAKKVRITCLNCGYQFYPKR